MLSDEIGRDREGADNRKCEHQMPDDTDTRAQRGERAGQLGELCNDLPHLLGQSRQ